MNMVNRRFALAAVASIALAGSLATGAAQARDADVRWSVTIGSPMVGYPVPVVTYPAPVPVYRAPSPVYYPAVPVHPAVHYRQPTYWDRDGDGIPNRYDRVYNPVWDRDGDGIPNRRDRVYNPAWDRDGDGIPNRRDPRYDPAWDRDGDGVPNRYDRHPDHRRGDGHRDEGRGRNEYPGRDGMRSDR